MKSKYLRPLFIVLLLIVYQASKAQDSMVTSGIYLTIEDYKNNKIIEEASCRKGQEEEFKKHDFFQRESFEVIYKGKRKTYLKSSIFAYRDCNNKVWRFYNNKEYEILEVKAICIYKLSKVVMNGITVEKDPVYYFSKGLSGEVKQLSLANLKTAYSDNAKFCDDIDKEFKDDYTDKAIHAYDFAHKMYKVNYIIEETKKK